MNDDLFFDRKGSTLVNVSWSDNWNAVFMQKLALVDEGLKMKILLISSIIE